MRTGIAVGAVGAAVTALLWWGAQDQARTLDPPSTATGLVPPDGYRQVGRTEDGTVFVEEDARLTGPVALTGTPPLVGGALLTALGDPTTMRVWRSVQTPYAGPESDDEGQTVTLSRLTDRGVEELAAYGAFTLVFDPPLLEVPADVHDGATWASRGDAVPGGGLTYSSSVTATSAGHGCFHLTGRLVFATSDQTLPQPVDQTWCPGRGGLPDQPATRPPWSGTTAPLTTGVPFDPAHGWTATPRPVLLASSLDDVQGTGGAADPSVDQPPVALPDGAVALVDSRGSDVWGMTPSSGSLVRTWLAHPGGDVTELGAAGAVTVAATTRREAVGYGEHGQWLWTASLPDVSATVPLAVDSGHVVLTTVLGDVVALDPATGKQAWAGSMSDQVAVDPVTDGRHVAVADIAGQVRLFDARTGEVAWSQDLPAPVDAMAVVDDRLVVVLGNVVEGLSLTDGRRDWSTVDDHAGAGSAVLAVAGTAVVASEDGTVALDARTGRRRWSGPGATVSTTTGDALLQLAGRTLEARSAEGQVLGHWPVTNLTGATRYLVPNGVGVLVTDSSGDTTEVAP